MLMEWLLDESDIIPISYGDLKLPGALSPMAKGKYLLNSNSYEKNKKFLDFGIKDLYKVLDAYIQETAWPTEPTVGRNMGA